MHNSKRYKGALSRNKIDVWFTCPMYFNFERSSNSTSSLSPRTSSTSVTNLKWRIPCGKYKKADKTGFLIVPIKLAMSYHFLSKTTHHGKRRWYSEFEKISLSRYPQHSSKCRKSMYKRKILWRNLQKVTPKVYWEKMKWKQYAYVLLMSSYYTNMPPLSPKLNIRVSEDPFTLPWWRNIWTVSKWEHVLLYYAESKYMILNVSLWYYT